MDYRISEEDSEILNYNLIDIRNAIYKLCCMKHKHTQGCTYCRELNAFCMEMEDRIRLITKNPISAKDAEELNKFIANME